jgi:hypothetical protein
MNQKTALDTNNLTKLTAVEQEAIKGGKRCCTDEEKRGTRKTPK